MKKDSFIRRFFRSLEGANRKLFYTVILPCMYKNIPLAAKLDARDIRSILVLRTDFVGDMICTTPMFSVIKKLNPSIRLVVACSDANVGLVRHDPRIDEAVVLMRGGKIAPRTLKNLQRQKFDVLLNPMKLDMTRNGLLLNKISRTGIKAALAHHEREHYRVLYNYLQPITANETQMHVSLTYIEILKGMFANVIEDSWIEQSLWISPEERSRWTDFSSKKKITANNFIVINLSVRQERNRWSPEGYRQLTEEFLLHYPTMNILLAAVGSHDEMMARQLEKTDPQRIIFFETRTVLEAAAMTEYARAVVTPDTGFLHIACAMKRPVVGLFSEKELHWKPFNVPSKIVSVPGYDVKNISARDVFYALEELMVEPINNSK